MDKMGFPPMYVKTIQHLYKDAESIVIINSEKSEPFCVRRGVWQKDPLSCLPFNLVIELLAQMLRDSELEGYKIPNVREKLIAMLFADDTTVSLQNR